MKPLKFRLTLTLLIVYMGLSATVAQIKSDLSSFQKIAIGPRIDLILEEGTHESISIDFENIDENRINYKVNGNTLRIYLDQAKYAEKYIKTDGGWDRAKRMYEGVKIKAHVTFKTLKSLNVRGDQIVKVISPVYAKTFSTDLQGTCSVDFEELICGEFKANVYGDVHLKVHNGSSADQTYRLYGTCEVDCLQFKSDFVKATCFGSSQLIVHPESLRMNAFGSSSVAYVGNPHVSKGLVVGDVSLRKIN